ncbi:hypothetical protein OUZ56_026441 [Daphnia magna]|uniref:Ricin B lectin domain-containing protein n=1 Tax=Daphnia magna TaxID=35525 RepID=A0ABQ9ZLR8_9CRUS|nr:hypothetical protein OUZ56_026441 [Daphnia magna]
MCLTVGVDETLKLKQCALEGDARKNQQWFFQTINTNQDVIENFPDVSLQDIQEVRLEQRRAVTTTINSPIFGDWTKCQDELKTFITSNDPLVQSQVSVGNCRKVTNNGQAFEYTLYFTIRPFNTNPCVKANTTMFILQECANPSSIWGTFEQTGQLMATDRTGLHSPASDRKCLTLKVGSLSLGHCHGSSRKQHLSFEYRNPHQIRTLSAAAIIALHTQQSLDGTQLPPIPPFLKRQNPPVTKDHTITEDAIVEIIDDTEQTAQQEIPEAASLTLEQVPETIKKKAVIMAQSNGILAASGLGLPICTRLQGFGQAMTLQQCETKLIFISAKESKCGFQPFFTYEDKNCTIGVDGWSIDPYSGCFWKTHLVNLNGFHHTWEHNSTDGEWVKQKANIHMPNLDLITEFEELHLNDFDYSLKSHPAHKTMEMEQLNILNDLAGLMQESDSKSVSDIVMSEKQDNQIVPTAFRRNARRLMVAVLSPGISMMPNDGTIENFSKSRWLSELTLGGARVSCRESAVADAPFTKEGSKFVCSKHGSAVRPKFDWCTRAKGEKGADSVDHLACRGVLVRKWDDMRLSTELVCEK